VCAWGGGVRVCFYYLYNAIGPGAGDCLFAIFSKVNFMVILHSKLCSEQTFEKFSRSPVRDILKSQCYGHLT